MLIVRKDKERKTTRFKNVDYGDVFGYDGYVYIKCQSMRDDCPYNCICMRTNQLKNFSDDVHVVKLQAELHIIGDYYAQE